MTTTNTSPTFTYISALFLIALLCLTGVATADSPRYTDNLDGTVTDTTTGLMWKRCAEGQTWTGAICSGTATTYTWWQAVALTSIFAGHNDWHLPNIRELQTIVDRTHYNPSIDISVFPNTPGSSYWSMSTSSRYSFLAWSVSFFDGSADDWYGVGDGKDESFYVRLARRDTRLPRTEGLLAVSRPNIDYVDNGNGTVTHTPTHLMWKRCAEGQTWSNNTCNGTASNNTWYQAQTLTSNFAGYSDWRTPTEDELISLVDYTTPFPKATINTTWFPNAIASRFWSISNSVRSEGYGWYVDFLAGYAWNETYNDSKDTPFQVRLVRMGQLFTLNVSGTGSGTIISNPTGINCGSDCSENYNSNATITLTANPATGSTFSGWSGSGCSGTSTCTVTMNAAKTVTATFNISTISHTITVTVVKLGAGSGKVISTPTGINCGNTCNANFSEESVTLRVVADAGSTFAGWRGGGCTGSGDCTMDSDQAIVAGFNLKTSQTIGPITFTPATLAVSGTTTATATGTSGLPVRFSATPANVCTTNGTTVHGVGAGTCTISAAQPGNDNYSAAPPVTQTLTVVKGRQVINAITFSPGTLAVGATATASANGGASGNPLTFASQTPTVCMTSGPENSVVLGMSVGTCTITTNQAGNENYTPAAEVNTSVLVEKGIQTLGTFTFTPATLVVDGTATVSARSDGLSGKPIIFQSTTPDICTTTGVNGTTLTGILAGNCTIAANQAGDASFYPATPKTQTLRVGKAGQTIGVLSFDPPTLAMGNSTSVYATASSGLAVSFTSRTPEICKISGNTLIGLDVGTCVVTADQAGNENYQSASQVSQTLSVAPLLYALRVEQRGEGNGMVTSYPVGISCGSGDGDTPNGTDCTTSHGAGTSVTLTALPAGGALFAGWGGDCASAGDSLTCTLTMNAARHVTASFMFSICGGNWMAPDSGTTKDLFDIAWSGTQFVAVGRDGAILTSGDGLSWTARYSGTTNGLNSVTWSGVQFVAVGGDLYNNSALIYTSPDGVTWSEHAPKSSQVLYGIVWNGALNQLVAVGKQGTILGSDAQATTWSVSPAGTVLDLNAITWNNTQYVVVGQGGTILTSPDGTTWSVRNAGVTSNLRTVLWDGNRFMVVGDGGMVLTSNDGESWSSLTAVADFTFQDLTWNGSQYVAVGDGVETSGNGNRWSSMDARDLHGIVWNGKQFVAVGRGGMALRSDCSGGQRATTITLNYGDARPIPRLHAASADLSASLPACAKSTVTAQVAAKKGNPTGTVRFSVSTDGTTFVDKADFYNLGSDGNATYTACLTSGSRVKASYLGSNTHQPSSATILFKGTFYTLTVNKAGAGEGTVTSSPAGINCRANCKTANANYTHGKKVTLTATPVVGNSFSGWSGDCTSAGTHQTCTLAMKQAHQATANFKSLAADLVVTGITITPAAPNAGGTFSAQITVKNQGGTAVPRGVTLALWSNRLASISACGKGLVGDQSVTMAALAPQASETVTFADIASGNTGDKLLRVFVDSTCLVKESNENNNGDIKDYSVFAR